MRRVVAAFACVAFGAGWASSNIFWIALLWDTRGVEIINQAVMIAATVPPVIGMALSAILYRSSERQQPKPEA